MSKHYITTLATFVLCVSANVILAVQVGKNNEVLRTTMQYLLEDTTTKHGNKNLMLGSSSIKKLGSKNILHCGPWLNRGIGGSKISSLNSYLKWSRLVIDPSVVLVYAGENDISDGISRDEVFEQYTSLINQLREKFQDSAIHVIGIKLSPARHSNWDDYRAVNSRMREYATELKGVFFHSTPGQDPDFVQTGFLDDGIHLTEQGYHLFTSGFNKACAKQ